MKEHMTDVSNPEGGPNPENLRTVSTGDPRIDQILGLDNFNQLKDEYFSNEANKRAYETGDDAFKNAVLQSLTRRAMSLGRGISGLDTSRMGSFDRPPIPGKEIRIDTTYGPRNVEGYSETDMNQNFQKMRQIMVNIESTRAPDGGDVNKESLMELSWVINHLRKKVKISQDMDKRTKETITQNALMVERMYQELTSRLNLHGLFLQFSKSNDADSVNALLSQISKDEINLFLPGRYKDGSKSDLLIWQAFQLYEQNADAFLKARGTDVDKVRNQIKDAILPQNGQSLTDVDRKSAQIMAEKLWSLLGRRAIKDKLVDKEYRTEATEVDKKDEKKVLEFEGEAAQGNFVLRRILSVEDWLISQGEIARPYLKLFRNVDLGTSDFLSGLPGQIESFWANKLYERYRAEGNDDISARILADENAEKIASVLTGIKKIPKEREDKDGKKVPIMKDGKQTTSWPKNNKVDLSQVNWDGRDENGNVLQVLKDILGEEESEQFEGIDFSIFGDNSLGLWAFRKVMSADKARDAMINKTASFLRSPSEENLKPLVDVFSYQSENQHATKATLIGNLVGFLASSDASKIDSYKLNIAEADARIFALARSMGLTKEDALKISKETLGDSGWDNLRIFIGTFGVDKGILAFIVEFIVGIIKQGLSNK